MKMILKLIKIKINIIFSNIITLKLYILSSFDLIDFMDNNLNIKNLQIYYKCNEYIKSKSIIILENIKNLRIIGNKFIYNNFKFPNSEYYHLNIENIENIKFEGDDDYDLINIFLMKNKFILKDLINIPNKLNNIKYLNKILLNIHLFIIRLKIILNLNYMMNI